MKLNTYISYLMGHSQLFKSATSTSTRNATATESNNISVASNVTSLLDLPVEIHHQICSSLTNKTIEQYKNVHPWIQSIIKNSHIDATSWFNQFSQQGRNKFKISADSLKNENKFASLIKQFTDSESISDSLIDNKEDSSFPSQLFYKIKTLMIDCKSFEVHEEFTINDNYTADSVTFSPDEKHMIITGSKKNTATIYRINTQGDWKKKFTVKYIEGISSASFSPNGRYLAISSYDNTAEIYELDQQEELILKARIFHGEWVNEAIFSPDGSYLVTISNDYTTEIHALNEQGDWKCNTIIQHDGWPSSVSFSPNGRHMVIVSTDNTTLIYGLSGQKQWTNKITIKSGSKVKSASFSPDSSYFMIAIDQGGTQIYKMNEQENWSKKTTIKGRSADFNPDNNHIITTSADFTTRIYRMNNKRKWIEKMKIQHGAALTSAIFSPDGSHFVTKFKNGKATIYGMNRQRKWIEKTTIDRLDYNSSSCYCGHSLKFSSDGSHVIVVSTDKSVSIYGMNRQGNWIKKAEIIHSDRLTSAIFSPDGSRVVTTTKDGTTRIFLLKNKLNNSPSSTQTN